MHLILTDRLTCVRCGPEFGLILLARRMEGERRVLEGFLGCANCREQYPVAAGVADLRLPPRDPLASPPPGGDMGEVGEARGAGGSAQATADLDAEARRVQALLGILRGPGTVLLLGDAARLAALLAALLPGMEIVAADGARHVTESAPVAPPLVLWPEEEGVSRMVVEGSLPFYSGMLRGVVVDGRGHPGWLEEATRVVARLSRVVVLDAPTGVDNTLVQAGLTVLAAESGTIVAAKG
ncbi:MAG: hypothetical protein ACE5GJ_07125 [Gemmatimonadota bacterium]